MRRILVVSLIVVGLLISSCDRAADSGLSNSKALPSELKQPVSKIITEIKSGCIVGKPTSKLAAAYVVNGLNTTGGVLNNTTAHLFLLNPKSGEFLRLSEPIGSIGIGEKLHIEWSLPSSSSIGAFWQKDQHTHLSTRDRAHYGFKPDILMFLSSSSGTYEIDSKKIAYYFPLPNGNYEETVRSLVGGSGREGFKKHNVALPGE